ncbi:hypothetical protein GUITHDRAFT_162104 [Guillardia theta CCMP2712]|uniref:Protein kinase domain-containing protein n=1 Tax=Guillardia theta (strain CCMP2712) TaxID=905079 RepID=L1JNF5_GUITC|nr:hypothetical protein GUITHDRAFT_162104 [Guillardia theta CCMP2712]EKX49784.1 hypothetical protein GUITHDRAFT_162104 [Guillardia theta CCMP2712]|mmetsp:Transcript_45/g.89  ORF Transcript_45/g.89 Transcript_45/m.89 type:complete len:445 (-) Transcript_45:66-1400(-)|eukprot:XP_005836764.1 hypothetical protein GUITHDRAFT_162104 [Guillardia theta CCMP2712]
MTCTAMDSSPQLPSGPSSIPAHRRASDSLEESISTPQNSKAPEVLDLRNKSASCSVFELANRYTVKKVIGKGAFGCVVAGEDEFGNPVAIKKLSHAVSDSRSSRRLLRELRFLRHVRGHPNVISVEDVVVKQRGGEVDVYIVTELMEADLEQIIKSSQALTTEHVRCLIFQIINGLRHIHSAGIVHRDLKPANMIVDSECRLKICDLGLSRHIADPSVSQHYDAKFTDYVVTRWYRAPELLLGNRIYDHKVDLWAAGCILGELLGRKALFKGSDTGDMLRKQVGVIGSPSEADLAMLTGDEAARNYMRKMPVRPRVNSFELFPGGDLAALELLDSLLQWDSRRRIGADEALRSSFLLELFEPASSLATNHCELAAISCGSLGSEQVTNLIFLEGALWRTRSGHRCSPIDLEMRSNPRVPHFCACSCGQKFRRGCDFLQHLEGLA